MPEDDILYLNTVARPKYMLFKVGHKWLRYDLCPKNMRNRILEYSYGTESATSVLSFNIILVPRRLEANITIFILY
jgi:hypothetical protein